MKKILKCFIAFIIISGSLLGQDIFIRTYGSFSGEGKGLVTDVNGNFYLAGNKYQNQSGPLNQQFCLYKFNSVGDTVWLKHYGGTEDDITSKIITRNEGGFAIIGYSSPNYTSSSITFLKINYAGDLTWMKSYGGLNQEKAYSILQTPSGGYFIGGEKNNPISQKDFYLIKTNINGDTLWTRSYGGSGNDVLHSIDLCSDGGVIMTGSTASYGLGSNDVFLIKVDKDGNVVWSKTFGGIYDDCANAVKQTSDGGYVVVGFTNANSYFTYSDLYLVRVNFQGDTLWTKTFKEQGKALCANDVILTKELGFAIVGTADIWKFTPPNMTSYIRGDVHLMKLSYGGKLMGLKDYSIWPYNGCLTTGYGNSVIQLPDESCVVGGTFFDCGTLEVLLIKTFDIGPQQIHYYERPSIKVYPNPSSGLVYFQLSSDASLYNLKLFDLNGKELNVVTNYKDDLLIINKGDLNEGLYFFKLQTPNGDLFNGKITFE